MRFSLLFLVWVALRMPGMWPLLWDTWLLYSHSGRLVLHCWLYVRPIPSGWWTPAGLSVPADEQKSVDAYHNTSLHTQLCYETVNQIGGEWFIYLICPKSKTFRTVNLKKNGLSAEIKIWVCFCNTLKWVHSVHWTVHLCRRDCKKCSEKCVHLEPRKY